MKSARTKQIAAAAIPVLAVVGFIEDIQTQQGVDDWVWYLLALLLAIFIGGRFLPFWLASVFSGLTLLGYRLSPPGPEPRLAFDNCLMGIGVFWITAALVYVQRRQELALRESEERLRKLSRAVEQSPVSIVITDKTGKIEYTNPKFCQVTGYSDKELIGANPRLLKSGEMSPEHYGRLWETIRSGKEWRGEFHNRKKNGEIYWDSTAISPIFDAAGQITHFLALKEDITERKRTQEELVWKTAFLEAQVDSSMDAILVVDDKAKVILRNDRLREMFKIPDEIAGNDNDADLLRWVTGRIQNPEQFIERVNYLYAHPDEIGRDELLLTDGTIIDRYSAPVLGKSGKYYGRIWTFRDITGPRRAEEKAREQAALLDKASDAIWVIDLNEVISYWNKGAERIYGWSAAEAIGKKPLDLLFKGTMTAPLQHCIDTLRQRGEWTGQLDEFTKDGKSITIEGRSNVIWDEQGRKKGLLIISTDITEKKKLEAQFLRSQRMESIGTLAGGIAHDLNNVLAPLMMSIQFLQDKASDDEARELLRMMETNVQRGARLVKQVLTFGRGVQGQRIPVQPRRIVREIGEIIQESFPKSLQFENRLAADLRCVSGDSTQLHQVLLNLCVNARDAMPDGGALTIEAANIDFDEIYATMVPEAKPGPYVSIKVSDTGTGMPKVVQDHIFEPFFTTKGLGKGTGLGLSTTLGIVKSHGGFINCYSELGKGTTFSVYLPAIATATVENTPIEPAELPRGRDELVLLVDDEEPIRRTAEKTLTRFGYRVLLAANGAEAVSLYSERQHEIAAVLTDMSMPVMDGSSAIGELRAINPAVKIIGSSGLAVSGVPALANGLNPDHFIPKPYATDVLLRVLREVLQGTELISGKG